MGVVWEYWGGIVVEVDTSLWCQGGCNGLNRLCMCKGKSIVVRATLTNNTVVILPLTRCWPRAHWYGAHPMSMCKLSRRGSGELMRVSVFFTDKLQTICEKVFCININTLPFTNGIELVNPPPSLQRCLVGNVSNGFSASVAHYAVFAFDPKCLRRCFFSPWLFVTKLSYSQFGENIYSWITDTILSTFFVHRCWEQLM